MNKLWVLLCVAVLSMAGLYVYGGEEVTERDGTVNQDNSVGGSHDKMGADFYLSQFGMLFKAF